MSKPCPKHGKGCYAIALNAASESGPVMSMELCPKCDAHLAPSGICLNACHLSDESRAKFNRILDLCAEKKKA